jgi:hypothetical protein
MLWLWRRFQIWRAMRGAYSNNDATWAMYHDYDGKKKGLLSNAEIRSIAKAKNLPNLPIAYVIYPDKKRSMDMPLGNAVQYLKIWGGTLVYHDIKIWHPGFIGRAKR